MKDELFVVVIEAMLGSASRLVRQNALVIAERTARMTEWIIMIGSTAAARADFHDEVTNSIIQRMWSDLKSGKSHSNVGANALYSIAGVIASGFALRRSYSGAPRAIEDVRDLRDRFESVVVDSAYRAGNWRSLATRGMTCQFVALALESTILVISMSVRDTVILSVAAALVATVVLLLRTAIDGVETGSRMRQSQKDAAIDELCEAEFATLVRPISFARLRWRLLRSRVSSQFLGSSCVLAVGALLLSHRPAILPLCIESGAVAFSSLALVLAIASVRPGIGRLRQWFEPPRARSI